MRAKFLCIVASVFTILSSQNLSAQGCGNMNLQLKSDIPSTCHFIVMTMIHDVLDRPYLYVANKTAGLVIYEISDPTTPSKVASVPISQYGNLDVMSLTQEGNYVYLALGDHFNKSGQASGM